VLALLVVPVLTSRFFTHHLHKMILLASLFSVVAALIGVALTRHILTAYGLALSTAGMVVSIHFTLFVASLFFSPSRGLLIRFLRQQRFKRRLLEKKVLQEEF